MSDDSADAAKHAFHRAGALVSIARGVSPVPVNLMHSRAMRRLGLAMMLANLIGAVVVTLWPFAFDLAPAAIGRKWAHVEWVLYYRDDDGRVIIDRDLVLNLMLLLPLGVGLAWWRTRRTWVVVEALALGLVTAAALEAAQLLTPHRVTQLADVWRNALGCVIGACAGVALRRRSPGRAGARVGG